MNVFNLHFQFVLYNYNTAYVKKDTCKQAFLEPHRHCEERALPRRSNLVSIKTRDAFTTRLIVEQRLLRRRKTGTAPRNDGAA
jgi:hypothetical protein